MSTTDKHGAAGLPRPMDFARHAISLALTLGANGHDFHAARAYSAQRWGTKSALTTTGTGSEIAGDLPSQQFLQSWRQRALLARLPNAIDLPTRTRVGFISQRPSFGKVIEGQSFPVTGLDGASHALEYVKTGAVAVFSNELLRYRNAERQVAGALLTGQVNADDATVLDTTTGILAGADHLNLGGGGIDDLDFALNWAVDSLTDPDYPSIVFIVSPATAHSLALVRNSLGAAAYPNVSVSRGGELAGLPLLVSEGVPADTLVCIDGSGIARNLDGELALRVSNAAAVEMRSVPTIDLTTPTATTLTSLFQTESSAILLAHEIAFQRIREGAVSYVSNFAPEASLTTA